MIDSKLITLLMVNELHSFTQAAKKLSLTPVSYTHLDVYKRQTEEKLAIFLARCIDDQKYEEEQQRQDVYKRQS